MHGKKGGYKNPHVIWQTVVFSSNEDEIDTLRSMAKKSYGVDAFSLKRLSFMILKMAMILCRLHRPILGIGK